ncbi:MAG TPA: hypothetical protein VM845_00365 [Burkholderiaceae bacterium]|jgi:hypothetical protein|nr:hypothetical protein [Burkholderiaceae bacterium]
MSRAPLSRTLAGLLPLLLAAGCATRSEDVRPEPADPAAFASMDCMALYDEADRMRMRATQLAYAVDERAGTNIVALGMGVTVFWPALLAMRPAGPDALELARLKGRDDALRVVLARKGCPPAPEQMAPERAARLPFALGERLVYEERAAAGGPARELGLRLLALRRDGIEFGMEPPGGHSPPRWRQDAVGNLVPNPDADGWVQWRRLLQPDLALGSVVSGEMLSGDGERGRVRGQVIALGVQSSLGRPFDAAVIELFGDVPHGDHSTRLDGVMVVDRKSGVLLRLELRSGNPEFALRRTLVRIEPAPTHSQR